MITSAFFSQSSLETSKPVFSIIFYKSRWTDSSHKPIHQFPFNWSPILFSHSIKSFKVQSEFAWAFNESEPFDGVESTKEKKEYSFTD